MPGLSVGSGLFRVRFGPEGGEHLVAPVDEALLDADAAAQDEELVQGAAAAGAGLGEVFRLERPG